MNNAAVVVAAMYDAGFPCRVTLRSVRTAATPADRCCGGETWSVVNQKRQLRALHSTARRRRSPLEAAERCQQRAVSPGQARSSDLAAQDRDLVPKDEDLQLHRATRPTDQPHQREQIPTRYTNDQSKKPSLDTTNKSRTYRARNTADEFANPTRVQVTAAEGES